MSKRVFRLRAMSKRSDLFIMYNAMLDTLEAKMEAMTASLEAKMEAFGKAMAKLSKALSRGQKDKRT